MLKIFYLNTLYEKPKINDADPKRAAAINIMTICIIASWRFSGFDCPGAANLVNANIPIAINVMATNPVKPTIKFLYFSKNEYICQYCSIMIAH